MYLIALVGILILLSIAFCFREYKFVIDTVGFTIVEVEEQLNGEKGQLKLEQAVIKIRQRLPPYLNIFMTKHRLVSIIEFMLNFINKAFDINKVVDIKGNEDNFDLSFVKEQNRHGVEIEYDTNSQVKDDINFYGRIKATTDFHGKSNATIEVGFQKRF